jgi:hypothetical protein
MTLKAPIEGCYLDYDPYSLQTSGVTRVLGS